MHHFIEFAVLFITESLTQILMGKKEDHIEFIENVLIGECGGFGSLTLTSLFSDPCKVKAATAILYSFK